MSEVTQIRHAIEQGDPSAAEQLLPLVYEELRQLAAQKLGHEMPGQTLQPTALVHEAYLRLVAGKCQDEPTWDNRSRPRPPCSSAAPQGRTASSSSPRTPTARSMS